MMERRFPRGAGAFFLPDPMQIPPSTQTIPSPCSGVCQLDPAGLCLGCRRSGPEIARWRQMGDDERRHFMHDILPARGWVPLQPVEE